MIEKYLTKLGSLLKKRQRPAFKNDLRAQLLKRAVELNEAPVKRKWALPRWESLLLLRGMPAFAAVLLLVLVVQFVLPSGTLLPQLVNVAEAKDYYTLAPETEDETGVANDSTFILSSKGELDIEEVKKVLTVEPATELEFEKISDNEIAVTPVESLDSGTVYSFELQAQNIEDSPYPKEYGWAYEVSDGFRITGTLPGDQENGVPTNSGIEVYFTHEGVTVEDFEKAFSISPSVSGDFEVNGKTGIFAPSEGLDEGTVYTVTINGNLALSETDKALGEEYVFEFETSGETRQDTHLSFARNVYEFSPEDTPLIQVSYWGGEDSDEDTVPVEFSVYSYKNSEAYLEALEEETGAAPDWAFYQRSNYIPNTSDLNKVVDAPEYTLIRDSGYWLTFPEKLPDGDYLVEISKNDATDYAFLQISNHAVYLDVNEANTLVWVNSTETGEAIEDAEVKILGSDIEAKTDEDGVAQFENLYEELDLEKNVYQNFIFEITTEDRSTYYEVPLYLYNGSSNDYYWEFLNTDRVTYQPTDTVYYWGFVQGRKEPIEEEVQLYLVEGYYWSSMNISGLDENRNVILEKDLSLQDAEAFEGKLDLEKLSEGTYNILLVQDDQVLSSSEFYVQSYVKPAYNLTVTADKTALFEGDTAHITVSANFFEGTPVPDTELRVNLPGDEEEIISTDENGEFELDWLAKSYCEEDCELYTYADLSVTPVQEELGGISDGLSFKVFLSSTMLTQDHSFENDGFDFQTVKVDLENIDYDANNVNYYEEGYPLLYGEEDSKSHVEMTIEQEDYVRVKVGEYYDEDDKVVRNEYEYEFQEKVVHEETLEPNGKGEYHYSPELSDEHNYEVQLRIFDSEGNYYYDRYTIYNVEDSPWYGSYISLRVQGEEENGNYVKIGDEVTVAALEQEEPYDGRFLFTENQVGVQDYRVTDKSSYSFTFGKEDVPSVSIGVVYFDGKYYREGGSQVLMVDTEDRRMELTVTPDQESYEPGEEVTLDVQASEAGYVNLYLVDEAYYALFSESFRDPLEVLYSSLSYGTDYSYISHEEPESAEDGGKGGCFVAGTSILMADGSTKNIEDIVVGDTVLTRSSEWDDKLVPVEVLGTVEHDVGEYLLVNGTLGVTEEHVLFINGQWQVAKNLQLGDQLINSKGETVMVDSILRVRENVKVYNFETKDKHTYFADDIYVHNDKGDAREDFRDTAFFTVVETDASGAATVKFTLPDNITQWRISATAVSGGKEIHAGYTSASLNVSKPVFVNPVINSTYLEGDQPSIPVRAYGDALEKGADITFSMKLDGTKLENQKGKAFETTYFDLPVLESGAYKISTTAKTASESDTVILPVTVMDSHFSLANVNEALLNEESELKGSSEERTTVVFTNNETGLVYGTLLSAYYENGDRADEALGRTLAAKWLNTYFDEELYVPEFDNKVYQSEEDEGGLALLPYADTDLELSAKMAALAPEQVDRLALQTYFESILNDDERSSSEKVLALYGLSGLDKAYLTELNYAVANFELSSEDKLYAALAYGEYGEEEKATKLFLEIYEENEGAKWKALLAALAQTIDSDLADELWLEAEEKSWDEEVYIPLEKLLFAKARLESGAQSEVSFTLNGDRFTLAANDRLIRSFLPEELVDLKFSDISGDVRAISFYQEVTALEDLKVDKRLSIERSYYVNGEKVENVKSGDLVEVHLSVEIPLASDFKNEGFRVTDYLPSGMLTATDADYENTSEDDELRHPYDQEGQMLSFYVYCDEKECHNTDFYYLARVINPGSFVLEPAVIQNYSDLDMLNVSGDRATLTIE